MVTQTIVNAIEPQEATSHEYGTSMQNILKVLCKIFIFSPPPHSVAHCTVNCANVTLQPNTFLLLGSCHGLYILNFASIRVFLLHTDFKSIHLNRIRIGVLAGDR